VFLGGQLGSLSSGVFALARQIRHALFAISVSSAGWQIRKSFIGSQAGFEDYSMACAAPPSEADRL
jgi:hypothetical protein